MFVDCQEESKKAFQPYTAKLVILDILGGIFFYGQFVVELTFLSWHALVLGDISVGDFSMPVSYTHLSDTPIQAICFQTVQHLKMCRNFSDILSAYDHP